MLRYKVTPIIRGDEGTLCLGCSRLDLEQITHANLGRLSEQGSKAKAVIGLAREIVVGIFGQRGSGKSYTLGSVIESLGSSSLEANIGRNANDRAVLLLDTLNIYQFSAVPISRIPDETLRKTFANKLHSFGLGETDVSLQVYFPEGQHKKYYTSEYQPFAIDTSLMLPEDYAHVFDIDLYRDPTGHLLLAAFDGTKTAGYRVGSEYKRGNSASGLVELIEFLSDERNTETSFERATVRALHSRMQSLARDPLFSSTPTSVGTMLLKGRVTILLLGHLSPPTRSLVATILIRQLFKLRSVASEASKTLVLRGSLSADERAAASEIKSESVPRTLLCIDEAQGYAPPNKSNPCTSTLIQYVKEGRNHGLSLILTSQQPSAIHPEVLSQIDCVVSHRLTVQSDIDAVLKSAKGRGPEQISSSSQTLSVRELLRELVQGQAYVSHGDAQRAFILEVRPRITAHGGIEV